MPHISAATIAMLVERGPWRNGTVAIAERLQTVPIRMNNCVRWTSSSRIASTAVVNVNDEACVCAVGTGPGVAAAAIAGGNGVRGVDDGVRKPPGRSIAVAGLSVSAG